MSHISSSPSSIMSNWPPFSTYLPLLVLLLCFTESCRAQNSSVCITSPCGNINISYPFRLKGDPANCGHPDSNFALECQKNQLTLHTGSRRYHVEAITYSNYSIRISDPGLVSNNISSCPIYSNTNYDILYSSYVYPYSTSSFYITYINCLSPVANPLYVENPFCGNTTAFSNSSRIYSYVTAKSILVNDLEESCTYDTMAQAALLWPSKDDNYSYAQIHDMLAYGFELLWYPAMCTDCNPDHGSCSLEGNKVRCRHYCYESTTFEDRTFICKLEYYAGYLYLAALAIGGLIALRYVIGIPCMIGVVVSERKRQSSSMKKSENIDELLRQQLNDMPINYSYKEIKKMTHNFKAKLGGGPRGSVFRGKLRSGPIAAVKMLASSSSSSSASDREFIRHVAEISRITNANVVKVFGFCIEGKKRGVVCEFVQCGSLEKYMSLHEGMNLSCGEMLKIAVGVANGIQCLHAAKILHLAIKPQNILLGEDFNPKISDPGLERFDSSEFKGEMGFVAPEMVYKNIGGEVSCKADVYSFGMLVLEMAAARVQPHARSEYFPLWIYKQLCEGQELEMGDGGEEEKEMMMMKKMVVAALWCIQINAGDRPMMEQVVGMLQGELELLHMPPMPFQRPINDSEEFIDNI